MFKKTGQLGYTLKKESGYYVPYLINPGTQVANISFFDPETGLFALAFVDKETGEIDIFDSGYPVEEFTTALKDAQLDEKPIARIKVEELGAGNEMGLAEEESVHAIRTVIMEFSPIINFVYEGFDDDFDKYIYTATLENNHVFQIQIESARDARLMRMVDFSADKIAVDGVPCSVYWFQPDDSNEARFAKLMEIYYSRVISINLDA